MRYSSGYFLEIVANGKDLRDFTNGYTFRKNNPQYKYKERQRSYIMTRLKK